MSLSDQFQFFVNSGYFENKYYRTETDLFCTSNLTGQRIRIQKLQPFGYKVYLKKRSAAGEYWDLQMAVANEASVFGVIAEFEDEWLDRMKKEEKDRKKKKTS